MPNRWERINGVLTPKLARASVQAEDKQILADYSKVDDFSYATTPTREYTVSGTFSAVANGSNFVSGTIAGNSGGITSPVSGAINPNRKTLFKAKCSLTDSDEELFGYIGLFETAPTDADPPVETNDAICFRLVETTANSTWKAVTATVLGTTETEIDTGVVVDLNTSHEFEITLENGVAIFKIDGSKVAETSATLPVATALLPIVKVTTGDTNAKGITVDALQVINSRA